jgi:signal transduction histidine kinase
VEALLGRRDADFNPNLHEVDHFRDDDLAVLREGKPKRVAEEVLTDATGRTRVLETIKIPFALGEAGTPTVLGVSTDLTERKRVEADLLHAQRMEGIGRLAGGVAHDFNNVLTAILGSVQLLEARLASDPTGRREVETIRTAAERAASLTRQLLTFARRDHAKPQPVDLAALTLDLERMLRRVLGSPVELVADVDPEAGAVEVDPGQMEQVVVNLVVNARDAMPRGGRLTIRTRPVPADACPDAARGHVGAGPWVELSVTDTGEGIPPAVLPRIFEPFFSTKHATVGTGLGLSICYGIVKRWGGHIWAETAAGRGSTYRVLLPRSEKAPSPRPPSGDAAAPPGRETVLVMDDEDAVRATMVGRSPLGTALAVAARGGVEVATHPGRTTRAGVVMLAHRARRGERIRDRPGTRVVRVGATTRSGFGSGSAALLGSCSPLPRSRTVRVTLDRAAPC